MPTLYRQYRPQTFAEVVGQDHITKTLQQAIKQDRISHAYLFQGPRGTGKTTTARLLAKRLNCLKAKDTEPCGQCSLCVAAKNNQNLDIIEIDAASNRGIDDIRALRERISLSPTISKYKVYIIDEVHMLTNEAFAALLKTLEEPVKHAIFILATTELHKVPATILSRCQVYRFRRATADEMRQRLQYILKEEKRMAADDVINFIIDRSDGCYRDAESLLGQLLTMQPDKIKLDEATQLLGLPSPQQVTDFLSALVANDVEKAVKVTDEVYNSGVDPEQFTREAIRAARDACLAIYIKKDSIPSFARLNGATGRLPVIIRALIQAIQDLAFVPQPLIALQLAVLSSVSTAPISSGAGPGPVKTTSQPVMSFQPKAAKIATGTAAGTLPVIPITEITRLWPQLIEKIKAQNPVAATFLRAIEPAVVEGSTVKLNAQFSLHLNFFSKPDNQKLVEQTLSHLSDKKLTVVFQLNSNVTSYAPPAEQNHQKEEELLKNVQEVFGVKAK